MNALMNLSRVAGPKDTMVVMVAFCAVTIAAVIMEAMAERKGDQALFNYAVVVYLVSFALMLAVILFVIFYAIGGRTGQLITDIGDRPVIAAAAAAVIVVRVVFSRLKKKRA